MLGQARQGVIGDAHAGAAGDVVDHDGQVRRLDDRHDVLVDALLAGSVVVGGVDEQALGARVLAADPDAHGVGGVVGAGAGDEHGAPGEGVLDLAQEGLLLGQVGGGGLAGGPGQEDEVGAVVDEGDGQGLGGGNIDLALGGEGRDHGDAHRAEGAGGQGALGHAPRVTAITRRGQGVSGGTATPPGRRPCR